MQVIIQSVSKVFIWFVFDESVAINISQKEDNLGFKYFDLLGGFLPFVTRWCWSNRKH